MNELINKTNGLNIDDSLIRPIKPIIKWVGGKTQIIKQVLEKFPTQMESYHEIFLGGGSVLFGLLDLNE